MNTNAVFLDLYAKFTSTEGEIRKEYFTDRVHLTHAGCEVIRNCVEEVLSSESIRLYISEFGNLIRKEVKEKELERQYITKRRKLAFSQNNY